MTERSPKICLISPTENLARRAKPLIMRRGMDVRVEVAELEAAVALAKRLLTQNDYLFISRRGTRDLLRKSLNIQVVNIPGEASDYIPAIQQLRHERGLIAFFSFEEEISNELRTICYLLDLKMKHYCFSDSLSCQSAVQQAVADGAAWGLGGVVSERFAKLYDLPYLRVESSDTSILHALDTAQQLYVTQQENARQQEQLQIQLERYQNILDYTHDAIIAIDENGRISTTNQIAEQMLRPAHPPFAGRPIEEVLPNTHLTGVLQTGEAEIGQMMNIHGTLVSTNRVPIRVGGQVKGVVATFQDIKTLQTAGRNIRIKLHEKGLVAKYRFSDILGQSPAILEAKRLSENFADSQFTVMLYGESGTGKEMFAQSIHNASPRRDGPFVAINCTALNRNLLESELFGYADSSFTGARRGGKAGLFETAHGGTIFLDEIGELPLEFQAPLRERGDDYLEIARAIYDRVMPQRSADERSAFFRVLGRCRSYAWPGNVRELTNTVERVSLLLHRGSPEEEVFQSLKMNLRRTAGSAPAARERTTDPATDKSDVLEALRRSGGNASRAAKDLGISRSTLYRRLKQDP